MQQLKINHLAVWVSVILLSALGFLWYGVLFQDSWMEMVGMTMEKAEANPPGAGIWITNLIGTVVPMYLLAWLFSQMGVSTFLKGAIVGFLIAFSFVFLSRMTSGLFADDPYWLAWIEGGFDMVALTIGGAIIGGWTKKS